MQVLTSKNSSFYNNKLSFQGKSEKPEVNISEGQTSNFHLPNRRVASALAATVLAPVLTYGGYQAIQQGVKKPDPLPELTMEECAIPTENVDPNTYAAIQWNEETPTSNKQQNNLKELLQTRSDNGITLNHEKAFLGCIQQYQHQLNRQEDELIKKGYGGQVNPDFYERWGVSDSIPASEIRINPGKALYDNLKAKEIEVREAISGQGKQCEVVRLSIDKNSIYASPHTYGATAPMNWRTGKEGAELPIDYNVIVASKKDDGSCLPKPEPEPSSVSGGAPATGRRMVMRPVGKYMIPLWE